MLNMCCFSAEILLTLMEFLNWTSVISWCKEHVGPLKIVQTYNQPTAPWTSQAVPCPRPQPKFAVCPSWASSAAPEEPGPEQTQECEEGWGRIVDLCPTCLTLLEESLVMSQSVCLSSCIHRSVTYCRPSGGGHWPKGAAVGGIPCSDECIPLSGQRPFTISSQKWRTLIFLLCPTFFSHIFDIST